MSKKWLEHGERSNLFAIRLIVWIALYLGRRVARLVLLPVVAYFLVTGARARAASRDYLARVFGRKPTLSELFSHFYSFAAVALDRVYFLSDRVSTFDMRIYGKEHILSRIQQPNNGCFLIGAHIGSFESLRTLGRHREMVVKLVMFEENAGKIAKITRAINPNLEQDVITLGAPESMLRVIEQLQAGAWVGMLADRAISESSMVRVPFLGGRAAFSSAPFRIAAMTGGPVILMLGLYRGGNRYDLHFEMLVEDATLPRANRNQVIEQWVRAYAARLEHFCREAPYNWFNFYDFWAGDEAPD